jgi:hypothetical protein
MKKIAFIFIFVTLVISQTFAQKAAQVPEQVKNSFSQNFPKASNVKWSKENENEWEAEFKQEGKEFSANFKSDGTWLETEQEIAKSDIPNAVKNTLDSQFAGYKIEEAEISKSAEGSVYEFELEKGESNMEVAISAEGKVVKKEMKNDEDDEED